MRSVVHVRVVLKAGVPDVPGSAQIRRARDVLAATLEKYFPQPALVVTSTVDGKHKRGSKHYDAPHQAEDFRFPELLRRFLAELRSALGVDYDVLVEADHIHIEYDPKGGQ